MRHFVLIGLLFFISSTNLFAQKNIKISKNDVVAHMEFLASDAMQGRGSGTIFEHISGKYFASQMRQFGIEPAGDKNSAGKKTYIQEIKKVTETIEPPSLNYTSNNKNVSLKHGKDMLVLQTSSPEAKGELQKIDLDGKPDAGKIVFVKAGKEDERKVFQKIQNFVNSGASAVIFEETPQIKRSWANIARRNISLRSNSQAFLIFVKSEKASEISKLADGTEIEIKGKKGKPNIQKTWNAVGIIKGRSSRLSSEVILLSAHMDHLGVRENSKFKDKIYNGADDDASGCIAILELGRILAKGKRPKRTVYFAFYGSEERGGLGSKHFSNNLPFPKEKLVANLQFEMIGRPDPKVKKDELWLTGYERSNLGLELAKRGAKLVKDPRPEQNFFQRSDNYALARKGVIAHTVSSFGLHKDYHRPSDEIETIDFDYMTNAINSMIKPIKWLANTDFKPSWNEGMKP